MQIRIPKPLKRLGCGVLIVLWFILLLFPCVAIVLVTQGEIVLAHSDLPNDDFRVWLIQQPRERGVALSNSHRVSGTDGSACTVIDGSFLMWEGGPAPSSHYCSCYKQQDGAWSSTAEGDEACQLAEPKQ